MKIVRNASEAGRLFPGAVVAIGKFDAMHRGHRKVLRAAVARARSLRAPCVLVTFDPSPAQFLRLFPYRPILSLADKLRLVKELGADAVLLMPFDEKLACLSPESFVSDILALRLKPCAVFVGEDFCFGRDRGGNVGTLERLGPQAGFTVHAVPVVKDAEGKISASRIRELIEKGRLDDAEKLLGRPIKRSSGR